MIYSATGMKFCQGAAQGLVWSHRMQSLNQGSKVMRTAVGVSYQRPPAAVPHWKTRSFSAWLCLIGWHGVGEELYSWRPSLAVNDGPDGQRGGEMIQIQGREYWDTEISPLTEKEWERSLGRTGMKTSYEKKNKGWLNYTTDRDANWWEVNKMVFQGFYSQQAGFEGINCSFSKTEISVRMTSLIHFRG